MVTKLCDLGWCIARLSQDKSDKDLTLKIFCPSDSTGGCWEPPQNVAVYGTQQVNKLKNFLRDNLEDEVDNDSINS